MLDYGFNVGDIIENLELRDFDGNVSNLYELMEGKDKFILNFSVDWCPDCQREKIKMNEFISQDYQNIGVAVVFINRRTNEEKILKYLDDNDFKFDIFYDKDNKLMTDLNIFRVPHNIVIYKKNDKYLVQARSIELDFDRFILPNHNELIEF